MHDQLTIQSFFFQFLDVDSHDGLQLLIQV